MFDNFGEILLRKPLFTYDTLFDFNGKSIIQNNLLEKFISNSKFLESIFWNSPSFYKIILDYKNEKVLDEKKKKKISLSLKKYIIRLATRPTPFGTFSGISIRDLYSTKLNSNQLFKRKLRIDLSVLTKIIKAVENNYVFKNYIQYRINNKLYSSDQENDDFFLLKSNLNSIRFHEPEIVAPYLNLIEQIEKYICKVENAQIGEFFFNYYEDLVLKFENLGLSINDEQLFQVDLIHNPCYDFLFAKKDLKRINESIFLLGNLLSQNNNVAIDNFIKIFSEKFDSKPVSLLEILDIDFGIGFPANDSIGSIGSNFFSSEEDNLIKHKSSNFSDWFINEIESNLWDDKIESLCNRITSFEIKPSPNVLFADIVCMDNHKMGNISRGVIPKIQHHIPIFYNSSINPIYKFLCSIQNQNRCKFDFDAGLNKSFRRFLPRIFYKNIILLPAHWIIHKTDIISENSEFLKNYFKKWKVCQFVLMVQGDNELFIDTNNEAYLEILLEEINKNERIILKECLSDPLKRNDYVNQFVLSLRKKNPRPLKGLKENALSETIKKNEVLKIKKENIFDCIHMIINRWFSSNQRDWEYFVYYFMYKYCSKFLYLIKAN